MTAARADIASKVAIQINEQFSRETNAEEVDEEVYQQIVTRLVTEASVELMLPPTQKRAQVFDEQGKYYVLVEVKRSDVMDVVRKMRANIDREARKQFQTSAPDTIVVDAVRETRNGG